MKAALTRPSAATEKKSAEVDCHGEEDGEEDGEENHLDYSESAALGRSNCPITFRKKYRLHYLKLTRGSCVDRCSEQYSR